MERTNAHKCAYLQNQPLTAHTTGTLLAIALFASVILMMPRTPLLLLDLSVTLMVVFFCVIFPSAANLSVLLLCILPMSIRIGIIFSVLFLPKSIPLCTPCCAGILTLFLTVLWIVGAPTPPRL